ncbi:Rne/Rng family ribonuclease [Arthrobacter sp. M4]|uniref:Rne/Rng family ribonuclease n=1 Tax=Arthrobacter sp. M4 TaxID=218160 RepID=UPI001CDBC995|nr:Rne/Rng family ribonuclease [Arthrobacter sp. M4]MCA4131265.1 Rne/Rng family ribonuclease [Arthrobacter sp. M4]
MDNDQVLAANEEAASVETAEAPKKTTRTRRKAAPKAAMAEESVVESDANGDAVTSAAEAEAPTETAAKAPVRRSRARKKPAEDTLPGLDGDATVAAPTTEVGVEAGPTTVEAAVAAPPKVVRRRRTTKVAAEVPVEEQPEVPVVERAVVEPAAVADESGTEAGAAPAGAVPTEYAAEPVAVEGEEAAEVPAAEERLENAAAVEEAAASTEKEPAAASGTPGSLFMEPMSITSMIFQAPDLSAVVRPAPAEAGEETEEGGEEGALEEGGSRRRRRSRGRRGRRGAEREGTEEVEETGEGGDEAAQAEESLEEGVTSRRRRRRRRGDQDLELTGGADDDPPNTITRVRAPRTHVESTSTNRVASVKGSTRLEAKKQRRRESRESGRRRQVITEAEFLARRESVDRQMVVRQRDDRIQIAVLEDGVLAEHFVSKTQQDSLIGNVYLGKVQNVLPSMEAAFVDIGRGRNAVLYAGEVNWDSVTLEGQPRRIENALKSGDSVLVQVTKDPVGHKGARLTSQISLPGRYLVYVPGGSMTGISRKLPDVERNRLKRILKDRLPEDAGVIVRTAAEGASEEELTHDINRLRAQWEGIQSQANSTKVLAPELLYGEPDLTIKVVRDVFNEDFSKLIVSGDEAWDTIEAYVTYVAPDLVGRLEKWGSDQDIFAAWRIDEQIHKALDRKVFLPSGGSLVIDRTEAMTVVDVNTGKFTGSGGNLEETVTKNNLEAAEEVVRQLRLRDIGGIIVIDFIDMVLESNRDLVLRRLVECLGRDRTKHQVAEVTSLGLVQMTRKRMGTGLLEVFGEQCEHCGGRGVVTHDEPVEHRRANIVAAEHHHQRAETQPATRPERKRRRGRGGAQTPEPVVPAPAPPVQVDEEAARRQAKAEATRAALANIAAAAHAAHLHEDELAAAAAARGAEHLPEEAVQIPAAAPEESDAGAAAGRPGPVLRFGGEEVALPAARHTDESFRPQPKMSLDLLAEAFAHMGHATSSDEPNDQGASLLEAGPIQESDAVPASEADSQPFDEGTEASDSGEGELARSRNRRGRRNRSASRAQGAANATSVEHHDVSAATAGGSAHQAKAPESAPARPAADEPIILGVGVPASEL